MDIAKRFAVLLLFVVCCFTSQTISDDIIFECDTICPACKDNKPGNCPDETLIVNDGGYFGCGNCIEEKYYKRVCNILVTRIKSSQEMPNSTISMRISARQCRPEMRCVERVCIYPFYDGRCQHNSENLKCDGQNNFLPVQCSDTHCWCVDHITGATISNTKVPAPINKADITSCNSLMFIAGLSGNLIQQMKWISRQREEIAAPALEKEDSETTNVSVKDGRVASDNGKYARNEGKISEQGSVVSKGNHQAVNTSLLVGSTDRKSHNQNIFSAQFPTEVYEITKESKAKELLAIFKNVQKESVKEKSNNLAGNEQFTVKIQNKTLNHATNGELYKQNNYMTHYNTESKIIQKNTVQDPIKLTSDTELVVNNSVNNQSRKDNQSVLRQWLEQRELNSLGQYSKGDKSLIRLPLNSRRSMQKEFKISNNDDNIIGKNSNNMTVYVNDHHNPSQSQLLQEDAWLPGYTDHKSIKEDNKVDNATMTNAPSPITSGKKGSVMNEKKMLPQESVQTKDVHGKVLNSSLVRTTKISSDNTPMAPELDLKVGQYFGKLMQHKGSEVHDDGGVGNGGQKVGLEKDQVHSHSQNVTQTPEPNASNAKAYSSTADKISQNEPITINYEIMAKVPGHLPLKKKGLSSIANQDEIYSQEPQQTEETPQVSQNSTSVQTMLEMEQVFEKIRKSTGGSGIGIIAKLMGLENYETNFANRNDSESVTNGEGHHTLDTKFLNQTALTSISTASDKKKIPSQAKFKVIQTVQEGNGNMEFPTPNGISDGMDVANRGKMMGHQRGLINSESQNVWRVHPNALQNVLYKEDKHRVIQDDTDTWRTELDASNTKSYSRTADEASQNEPMTINYEVMTKAPGPLSSDKKMSSSIANENAIYSREPLQSEETPRVIKNFTSVQRINTSTKNPAEKRFHHNIMLHLKKFLENVKKKNGSAIPNRGTVTGFKEGKSNLANQNGSQVHLKALQNALSLGRNYRLPQGEGKDDQNGTQTQSFASNAEGHLSTGENASVTGSVKVGETRHVAEEMAFNQTALPSITTASDQSKFSTQTKLKVIQTAEEGNGNIEYTTPISVSNDSSAGANRGNTTVFGKGQLRSASKKGLQDNHMVIQEDIQLHGLSVTTEPVASNHKGFMWTAEKILQNKILLTEETEPKAKLFFHAASMNNSTASNQDKSMAGDRNSESALSKGHDKKCDCERNKHRLIPKQGNTNVTEP